jgi:murein DD-endopeptidase MepM/ murein hydrolase activator NlpD
MCREASCDLAPSQCNETLPLLQPPFDGTTRTSNLFDHRYPLSFSDTDRAFASYCGGGNRSGALDGHSGYDWALPEGTPVLAVADGTVTFAGMEGAFFCPLLNRDVAGLWVQLETRSPYGERFWVQYLHLSRLLTVAGQSVRSGEAIALSGNTGCSTGPHLHLQVLREHSNSEIGVGGGFAKVADPYGWQGPGHDPWALASTGAASAWLWIQPPHISSPRSSRAEPGVEGRRPEILDMNNVPTPEIPR